MNRNLNRYIPWNQTLWCLLIEQYYTWPIMTRDGCVSIVMRVGAHGSIQHLSSSVWCGVGTMVDTGLIIWPTPLIYILTPHWTRHMSPVTAPAALLTTTFAGMGGSRNQLQNKLTSREGTEKLCIFRNILHSSSHPMQRTERRIMLCLGLYFVSSCKLEMS